MAVAKEKVWEDVWVNTACGMCYSACAIRVRRINGVPVKIEGFPESTLGAKGGLCGKGAAGLMLLHDPNRLNVPLRRTNPEKGIGVDPKWKEITWEEALDEITERLKKIRAEDPNKLVIHVTTSQAYAWATELIPWATVFGTHSVGWSGGSLHCGNASHLVAGVVHGSWSVAPDWKYTQYVLKFGSSKGTGSGHSATINARLRAEAMARGVKEVSFDPICNFSGGKASEWIPIIPGTDTAVVLAMANVILNEIGVYDVQFLKKKTNLPYLIGHGGRYVRDKETGRPLVWDAGENRAKVYNDPTIGIDDYALEGEYEVKGVKCRPSFVLLKEHLKKHTPEWASKISTVPAGTIRRLAREWIDNARIGSTITIEGKTFPYRPVAAIIFRGAQGHTNGVHQCVAIDLLNVLAGAEDVPGGCLGWPAIKLGHPDTGHYNMIPREGPEGVIIPSNFWAHDPWPLPAPEAPVHSVGCHGYWTAATVPAVYYMKDQEEIWQKLGLKIRPEMAIIIGANTVVSTGCWEDVLETQKYPFVVQFDLFSNETAEAVADILLPDQSYLERLEWKANIDSFFFNYPPSYEDWWFHPQVPVVEKPIGQRRYFMDVLIEVTNRLGFRDKWNAFLNFFFKIDDPAWQLKPDEKPNWTETGDRILKWCFGSDKGVDYFKEKGCINWPKKIKETYWRWNWDWEEHVRIPVYQDYLLALGEKTREIGQKAGLKMEYEMFNALPSFFPTPTHKGLNAEYDLIGFSYRDALHTNNATYENPWIDEASQLCPYTYTITMNADAAKKKGLKDGDLVWVETPYRRREKGILKTMEGQHPQTVGMAGQGGLWARGRPVAKGKGSNFTRLLPVDLEHTCPITLNMETSVPVKVYKAEEGM